MPRPGGLAVDAVPPDRGFLPLVPRPWHLLERTRLVLPRWFQQDGYGLPRNQLVAAKGAAARTRPPKHVRWHLGQDPDDGLDVRAAGAVPGRRRGGDHRAASLAPTGLRAPPAERPGLRRPGVLPRAAALRRPTNRGAGAPLGRVLQSTPRNPRVRRNPFAPRRWPRPGRRAAR